MSSFNREVAKLEIVPVRQAFKHEAYSFTKWLESHIDVLGERLEFELSVVGREQKVGDFVVDLLCEDGDGAQVVIENQLERTDHSHLGQLLTYLVNLNATTAIWITTEPRPEHQRVIEWLNESSSVDFYLIKVEAARIGDSPYAPLFTPLVAPDRQSKEVGEQKKEWAARHHKRYDFWKTLLEKSKGRTKLFSNTSPGRYPYISMGAGLSGVAYTYTVTQERGTVELYIDRDKEEGGLKNKQILDFFLQHKKEIQESFGGELEWEPLEGRRAARIRKSIEGESFSSVEKRDELQNKMIDAMIRFHAAIKPFISKARDI